VNWKRIVGFSALLFLSGVIVGFVEGGFTSTDTPALREQLFVSLTLSFGLSFAVFSAMSFLQRHRPFLHALSATLLLALFSFALTAAFPAIFGKTPVLLIVLDWLALGLALVIGTFLGRYMASKRRVVRADA
jgi:hypothetical protein